MNRFCRVARGGKKTPAQDEQQTSKAPGCSTPRMHQLSAVAIFPLFPFLPSLPMSQPLSAVELCSRTFPTLEDAERAIEAFCATQGWAAAVRKTRTIQYNYQDQEGTQQIAKLTQEKLWICSKGRQREPNDKHVCGLESVECDKVNSGTALSAADSSAQPGLPASFKSGCGVEIRVRVLLKPATKGHIWTEKVLVPVAVMTEASSSVGLDQSLVEGEGVELEENRPQNQIQAEKLGGNGEERVSLSGRVVKRPRQYDS
jgi:hypothetical protein